MTRGSSPLKLALGSGGLVAALAAASWLLASPGVAAPAARVAATISSALDAEHPADLVVPVESLQGIAPGLPVFFLQEPPEARPLAHVHACGEGADGAWVRLRFEPDAVSAGPWTLTVHAPSRSLRGAAATGITPEAAERFGRALADRLSTMWAEVLLPESRAHLPSFLDRIDPTRETESRVVLQALSGAVVSELEPLLDELAGSVTSAVKHKFDVLDRLGLLWKVVRGDEQGLRDEILPVAKEAARAWWTQREPDVLRALGRAFSTQSEPIRAWAEGELFEAARDELVLPVLTAQSARLEAEGEALLRLATREFIEAPEGGFRVRFAALLRTQLLGKRTALLLLDRPDALR
ncbi:MAG: hypothetical protein O2894_12360 [Planctomycetota bacterium]|nr:hypothetical protein [Planctomycetota bacterium]